jgi:triosephosphate isomerase
MNLERASAIELAESILRGVEAGAAGSTIASRVDVAVFPPSVYLDAVGRVLGQRSVLLGAQDCSAEDGGAFTGQVSANMLTDLGVQVVLVGHSERRHGLGETDDLLARKARIAIDYSLIVVFCVGETLSERQGGAFRAVLERQLRNGLVDLELDDLQQLVVAYEPVWAIGTGNTATPGDAQEAHAFLRSVLADRFGGEAAARVRIIYGGSVNAANAAELFSRPDIDGGLVGGASLSAEDFLRICRAASPSSD